ncbi:ribbon-helix-helix protein, CopG family [Sphingobium sp. ba1]|nr:ribbon-helix-helix protein, CopG family [Sphingobium sp. ba1]
MVGVRLQPDQLAALDAWIAQRETQLSRPEAIRVILREKLL